MPLLGLLLAWAVRGSRPPAVTLVLILGSFGGVSLVITGGDYSALLSEPRSFAAYVPLLLGALCWVIYTFGASYFPTWSPYRYTAITTLLGLPSIFLVNSVLITIGYIPLPAWTDIAPVVPHLAYMALVAGLLGVLCWNMGNKVLTPLNGVLFMDVVPITAFSVSALTGVIPNHVQVFGACVTATALVLNNLYQRQRMNRVAVPKTKAA